MEDQPILARRWSDELGVIWDCPWRQADPNRVEKLLRDPATRVLCFHVEEITEVLASERNRYWSTMKPYVTGKVRRVAGERANDHFDCRVAEFRDLQRRVLLIFEESC